MGNGSETRVTQSRGRQLATVALPPSLGAAGAFAASHLSLGVLIAAVLVLGAVKFFGVLREALRDDTVVLVRQIGLKVYDRVRQLLGIDGSSERTAADASLESVAVDALGNSLEDWSSRTLTAVGESSDEG
jgi:hypothetical protein